MSSSEEMSIDGTAAAALCTEVFPSVIDFLRPGLPYAPPGPLRSAAETIRRLSNSEWRLDSTFADGYDMDPAQAVLRFSQAEMGALAAAVVTRCETEQDLQFRRAMACIAGVMDVRRFLVSSLLALFAAHEMVHVAQRLGSKEYKDSDGYADAVSLVDYYADAASIFYVHALQRSERPEIPSRELLLVLIILHVAAMQHFSPVRDGGIGRVEFERIMTWYWQAARVAAAGPEPDTSHPSLMNRPVICLPETDGLGLAVARPDSTRPRNEASLSRQDVVVAFHCTDGSPRIYRLRSTSEDRVPGMVCAVFDGNLALFRSHVQEVFSANSHLLDLSAPHARKTLERLLVEAQDLASAIQDGEQVLLSRSDLRLFKLFDRVALLLQTGGLSATVWDGYGLLAEGKVDDFLDLLAADGDGPSEDRAVRRALTRVACRLALLADDMLPP